METCAIAHKAMSYLLFLYESFLQVFFAALILIVYSDGTTRNTQSKTCWSCASNKNANAAVRVRGTAETTPADNKTFVIIKRWDNSKTNA